VKLALEPIHRMYVDFVTTIAEALEIVAAVNHPNVGLVIDTYHVWQEPNLLKSIAKAGPHILGVHISDWHEPPRSPNDRLVMGDGVIPLREIIAAIEATGYQGFYDVEIFSDELWVQDYHSLLRRCQSRFEAIFEELH